MSGMVVKSLDALSMSIARRTLSAWAFYYMAGDALLNKKSISTVRMGDGERKLMQACEQAALAGRSHEVVNEYDEAWRIRMGIEGITYGVLYQRLRRAGNECSHFAPNISGVTQPFYSVHEMFDDRAEYLDNFFVNIWTQQAQAELYKAAGSILFLHANRGLADAFQRRTKDLLDVKLRYIELNDWRQAQRVIEQSIADPAPLVLFSGGPSLKFISPVIAAHAKKVVLDLGNSADQWALCNYKP